MKLLEARGLNVVSQQPRVELATTGSGDWDDWDRYLRLDDVPVFHIGNVCDTCAFFFRRCRADISQIELQDLQSHLAAGIANIDDAVLKFSAVLPSGSYTVALFEASALPVTVGAKQDYFAHDQLLTWRHGAEPVHDPNCEYYRAGARRLTNEAALFEFLVPLQDRAHLTPDRVQHYVKMLRTGRRPTAVALSILDVKGSEDPPTETSAASAEVGVLEHWCLANYLLDGHHKVAASASCGLPIGLLAFISHGASWNQVGELLETYRDDS